MKRWLPHIGIALGVLIAVYAIFFASSDEDLIRKKLAMLEEAVAVTPDDTNIVLRAAYINKQFAEIFDKGVTFDMPEVGHVAPGEDGLGSGRAALAGLAAQAPRVFRAAKVDLGGLDVKIDDTKTSAVAYGDATLSATRQAGEIERDTRTVSLSFDKIEGDWRVVKLSVSPRKDSR